jgi:ornithine cyclodeaminase/alanine dehydrogenase-like protein (mu-crystallin family)
MTRSGRGHIKRACSVGTGFCAGSFCCSPSIGHGTIDGDDIAVIKVATGFCDNPVQGLPPFGGLNLVMSARTGLPLAVLLDGGC